MTWPHFLSRRSRKTTKRPVSRRKWVSSRGSYRPVLEVLEDRTLPSASMVKDINPVNYGSLTNLGQATDVNGTLFFVANDDINGEELWKSDGTAAGTSLVKDITPGPEGSYSLSG